LGEIDPVEIIIRRDVIPLISVLTRSEPGDRIAHIRVTDFYADTAQRLYQALIQAVNSGAEGLILDVRDNPGGLLSSAITVTSIFLDDGLALYDVDGNGTRTNHHLRNTGGIGTTIPMVVLANEYSASASEILIGAIQDRDRATVVGATTFGKGSVGILRRLNNGAGLFMTTSRWYTPSGRLIQGIGLDPDIKITTRNREEAESQQLEKAFELLEQKLDK
jgi:carboxyl-terminal processing protease